MSDVRRTDLAWAAGLFEGEGTIAIARRGQDDTYRLLVTISNTDEEIIDFFYTRWGGWRQGAYGERPGRKPAWTWTVAAGRAEGFLRDIAPFLRTERVRRKHRLAVRFRLGQSNSKREQNRPDYKARQRECYEQMRELNRRGIKVAA